MAGTRSGLIVMSTSATTTTAETQWTEVQVSEGRISDIAISNEDNNVAYATVSTFGVPHVMKTMDGGATWMAYDNMGAENGLPDIPANTIVIDPSNNMRVIVGTDLGVFVSVDGGMSWAVDGSGFANTPVAHLEINNGQLYAFTHGRSAYRVSMNTVQSDNVDLMLDEDTTLMFSADTLAFKHGLVDYDSVVLSALPQSGHLMLNDEAVTNLEPISAEDFVNLKYVPPANYHGAFSIDWYVTKDGNAVVEPAMMNFTINSVNDAPAFEISVDTIFMADNAPTSRTVTVTAGEVPADESEQTVTYSLSPEIPSFLTGEFDVETGELTVAQGTGSGEVEFTITADDGQAENNTAMNSVNVTVVAGIPEPVVNKQSSGGGGSMGFLALLSLPLLSLRRRFKKA